jgi:hypothetical protein
MIVKSLSLVSLSLSLSLSLVSLESLVSLSLSLSLVSLSLKQQHSIKTQGAYNDHKVVRLCLCLCSKVNITKVRFNIQLVFVSSAVVSTKGTLKTKTGTKTLTTATSRSLYTPCICLECCYFDERDTKDRDRDTRDSKDTKDKDRDKDTNDSDFTIVVYTLYLSRVLLFQ